MGKSGILLAVMNAVQSTSTFPEWSYNVVFRPYMEGAIRINRFFSGVDLQGIAQTRFSWKERFVELLVGLALSLPFINAIVWLGMQMFNQTRPLSNELGSAEEAEEPSDVYSSESEDEQELAEAPAVSLEPVVEETFETVDYLKEKGTETIVRTVRSEWIVRKQGETTTYDKEDEEEKTVSEYVQGLLVKFECHWKSTNIRIIAHKHGDQIRFTGTRDDKTIPHKHCELKGRVWIQQQTVGFGPFLNSADTEYPYVMVHPFFFSVLKHKTPELEEIIAEKTATDEGSTIKLVVQGFGAQAARWTQGAERFDAKFHFDTEGKFRGAKYITLKVSGELLSGTYDVVSEIVKPAAQSPESGRQ